uniref:Cytochrome c oxidase subunit 3 n=1 Tax=Diaphanes citrinus TaxID=2591745 RepID=A0A7G3L100_9COLE|nr:cytochrome c oxidase subunit III [Diaphanes citrinus]QEO18991.1 cytochrome c oxidase subunit III [Diaphanes citrinus]
MTKNHIYHLVETSPWPILGSLSTMNFMISLISWFHTFSIKLFLISLIMMSLIMYQWWRDISREGSYQGLHTSKVLKGLRWGMILFIISEIFFFLSFFWSFYHSSLSPSIEIGMIWPPKGIKTFNPLEIPLLNTLILISSGISVTWAHHSLMENNYLETIQSLMITVGLGCYFSMLQSYEYFESSFSISDSIYGSSFFLATGFHGLHVIIGTSFLMVCLYRLIINQLSSNHHFGFEAAAWYWHFVDMVWLLLYISIYWWGS